MVPSALDLTACQPPVPRAEGMFVVSIVVLPLTQTFNGPETPGIRIHDVTTTGFLIRLNEVYAGAIKSDGKHTTETIGWLASTV